MIDTTVTINMFFLFIYFTFNQYLRKNDAPIPFENPISVLIPTIAVAPTPQLTLPPSVIFLSNVSKYRHF